MITMQKEFYSLTEAKKEFLLDCKVKNLSKSTIKNYDECFTYFINYINNAFKDFNLKQDMSKSVVSGYIMEQKSNGLKDSTINIRIRAIRCVLYYLMRNKYINSFKISEIKENNTEIELYTDNEIQRLLKKPNMKKCSFAEYRTWVIINFLVATGVRSRSLRNIKIEDLDFDNELIHIKVTKNRKAIIIPMGKTIKKILLEYLRIRKRRKN